MSTGPQPKPVAKAYAPPTLDASDIARYSRHILLDEVGVLGQTRLKGAAVLCVGTGGLGSPALLYLAAAGVGRIGIVDFDLVDTSNLQRQVIHGSAAVGQPKLESARQRILDINPRCQVDMHPVAIVSANALEIIAPYDVVIDGTDNFPTRYLVNDACVLLGKPYVYGSIYKFEGQASVFNHQGGPQYRDLYPEPPPPDAVPSCAEGGVLGVLPGVIGTIQATEALKILLGIGTTLSGRVLLYDALQMQFRELRLGRDPAREPPAMLKDYVQFCTGSTPGEPRATGVHSCTAHEVAARRAAGWRPVWIDVRRPAEWELVRLPEADRLVPHTDILHGGLPDLAPTTPILLQCKSGARSAQAAAALVARGFTDVTTLEGGILGWIDAMQLDLPKY